ncbi:MAG: DNA processing protein [Pseudoalteromonas tetraodonis]|jgi:DNA processing protein
MENMTQREAYLALNLIPNVGPIRVRRMLETFETPERILSVGRKEIQSVQGIGAELAERITTWERTIDLERELRRIDELGLQIITLGDDDYPAMLKGIYDPPLVLYVKGELAPSDRQGLAIVGSRKSTHYGLSCAKKLSFQLAHAGVTIISGLARGIDTAAHEGALAANGRTIAVIGSGHGKLYPPENAELAEKISHSGAVISEFPVDYPPDKQSFPLRNRIVSGWSFGVLVVEAAGRSGALITANQAAEQGRSVYAVPGPIDRPSSLGANRLIQQGAKLVLDGGDVLEDLETLFPMAPSAPKFDAVTNPAIASLSSEEKAIYEAIEDDETAMESLIERTGLPSATVSSTLMRLQIKRLVKQLPGQYFVKLV